MFSRTQYTVVWSDPGGLDLMSAEGTYVRASVESLDAGAANGTADAAAPGFRDTLAGAAKAEADDFFEMGPVRPEFGVKRYEVLAVNDGRGFTTVTVCSYNQQVGHHNGVGEYEFSGTGPFGSVLTFEKIGDRQPPSRQSGSERFTAAPVFGSWRTTQWELGDIAGGDPCAGRALPGVAPGSWPQTRGSGPHTAQQPPSEANFPGWPPADNL